MRLSNDDLKNITARTQPKAQANWFKRFYGVDLPHDRKGVIITAQARRQIHSNNLIIIGNLKSAANTFMHAYLHIAIRLKGLITQY